MAEKGADPPADEKPAAPSSEQQKKRQKLSVKERFSEYRTKTEKTEASSSNSKGKGKATKGFEKDKNKPLANVKQDPTLYPANLAQLNVAFTTQSFETNVGVLPGNVMKVGQIARDM